MYPNLRSMKDQVEKFPITLNSTISQKQLFELKYRNSSSIDFLPQYRSL